MNLQNHQSGSPSEAQCGSLSSPEADEIQAHTRLLIAVANYRDRQAFATLFKAFARRIYGMGMKMSRNEQLAKDLVQDVMLAVWKNAASFNLDKGTAQTWIFTLTRNKCIDSIRRASRQPQNIVADDIWPEDLCDPATGSDTEPDSGIAADAADLATIERLSDKLPLAQRLAIEMVYLKDFTHEEAALELEIPLGTFKSRLRLGLIKLRELVND